MHVRECKLLSDKYLRNLHAFWRAEMLVNKLVDAVVVIVLGFVFVTNRRLWLASAVVAVGGKAAVRLVRRRSDMCSSCVPNLLVNTRIRYY